MAQVGTSRASLFRRLPSPIAFSASILSAAILSILFGLMAGWCSIFLFDRGNSKGNDLAVGLSAFFAVGTFCCVVVFSWLCQLYSRISWRTPLFALLICLSLPTCVTLLMWDPFYEVFILAGWVATLLSGLSSLVVARRFLTTEEDWAEMKLWSSTKEDSER